MTISSYTSNIKCSEASNMIQNHTFQANLTVFGSPFHDCTSKDIQIFKENSQNSLLLMDINGVVAFKDGEMIKNEQKPFVINSTLRSLIITGDDVVDGNAYLKASADIIISFLCDDIHENLGHPERSAMIIAQTTGAHRLHITHLEHNEYNKNKVSFLVNAAGELIFRENSNYFTHTTKLAPNIFILVKEREIILDVILVIACIISLVIVFKPDIVSNFVNYKIID